jgi:superfamily II DNA or RNA helicase
MSKTRIWSVPREQREKLAADLKRVRTVAGDYDRRELGRKMSRRSLVGDIVSHWKRLGDERPTVVYGVTIAHAKRIEKAFKRSRITVELVHAKTRADDRHAMLERLRAGDTKVIVNCMILTEGWDCPVAKCIVLARPTKSLGLYLQMLGRGTRPGKTLIVLDHSGMAHQHGFPDTDRNVSLDGVEKSAGGRAPCKVCPSCDAVIAAAAAECPECGLAFLISREPDEKAGTLSEIDRQSIDANVDQFAKRAAQAGLPSKVVAALASSRRAALTRAQ